MVSNNATESRSSSEFKNASDSDLLNRTQSAVQLERQTTLSVFTQLREIEKRRLFSALGCSSLFSYCVQKLGFDKMQIYL